MREKVTQEAFRQFHSLLQRKPAGHPAQFPAFSYSGSARCAPVDFNDLRRYTVRIIFTLNTAVCAFQAELVYAIGHPQTDGRSCGNTAAGKINMKPLVSKVFKFDEYQDAFKYIENNKDESLKILIEM